jgi:hypothetical protein
MKVGDLVKITHGSMGIPNGALAVVVRACWPGMPRHTYSDWNLYGLRLVSHPIARVVRFRAHSLELVNESR